MGEIAFIICAYLFGSLPVLYLIGRLRGYDLRLEEDMHLSLWRKVGYAEGLAGILWDVLKGPIPPLAARWLGFDIVIVSLSGLAVVCGQMWPIFLSFKNGEKGNTTGMGAALAISPSAMGIALIPIAVGALTRLAMSMKKAGDTASETLQFSGVSNSMPLGMLIGFAVLPLTALALRQDVAVVGAFLLLFSLIVLRRLTADLGRDIQSESESSLASILRNRLFFDRSHYDQPS